MSFDFSRRGFLNLLGLGGVGLAIGELPPVPLFGSDEVDKKELVRPDESLVLGHVIVFPKTLIERVPEAERQAYIAKHGDGVVPVARLPKFREPRKFLLRQEHRFSVRPQLPDGTLISEAHAAFYVASNEIRQKFASYSRDTLAKVDPELRPMATLVTIADAPIHARPMGIYDGNGHGREERQFDVVCDFRQFVVLGAQRSELETYRIYSEMGEFPVQVPRDIEMGMMIKLDREVMAAGVPMTTDRITDVLARFTQGWGRLA